MKEGVYTLQDKSVIRVTRVGRFWQYKFVDDPKWSHKTFPLNRVSWQELRGQIVEAKGAMK